MKPLIEIIIPTYNNWEYMGPCLNSILMHRSTPGLAHITIINNGHEESIPAMVRAGLPEVTVLHPGKNLGWEGGLKYGLEKTTAPYVIFMNDDTYVPASSAMWMWQLINHFSDAKVAAVGPSSNVVMGMQNIFISSTVNICEVNFLIGFCMMVRREALEKVGGVDDSLPYHGDDLDLSIRFRKAGYKLIMDRSVFIYHHGFKTGGREFGNEWNSVEMTEKTNKHLIKKHGLKSFWETINQPKGEYRVPYDTETDVVAKYASGSILELGCGDKKTVEPCVGVDIVPKGQEIPGLVGKVSVADIVADVQERLPIEDGSYDTIIARHILEHFVNTRRAIKDWGRVLKHGGKLIIAVPDEGKRQTVPMNYQHVRAFTQDSLREEMEDMGWITEAIEDAKNDVSFVGVFRKNGLK